MSQAREIKFRYTCVKPLPHIFSADFTIEEIENGRALRWMELNYTGSGILYRRQYTGLKDKNGKEIYEGDLGYFDIAPNNLIEIKIEEGAVSYWSLFNMGHKFEVVGNIYERPELLTKMTK